MSAIIWIRTGVMFTGIPWDDTKGEPMWSTLNIDQISIQALKTAYTNGGGNILEVTELAADTIPPDPIAFYETLIGVMGECPLNDVYKDVSAIALNPSIETSALNYAISLFNGALHHDWNKPYAKDAFASAYGILKGFLTPEQIEIVDAAIIEFNLG